ncbi:DUF4249 family protein [Formosa sediminum]|uniref:DUF4249 family protein n=1 Tax=Formosa sediminum TaxID=2594004 RepID=A0A516GUN5_9FLAO|nr:DUF4249 family protein [Formosa sediminum]QDO95228.1 DUF4249 family protein [Formosa sediminum]
MNVYNKLSVFLMLISLLSCEDVPDFNQEESKPVVEAYIYEGEPVNQVYIKKTIPYVSGEYEEEGVEYINDANVILTHNEQDYMLLPMEEDGRYFYDGTDLEIQTEEEYELSFTYEGELISSTTMIPDLPENVAISNDEIYIPQINSIQELANFQNYFEDTVDISWNNPDNSYYYIVIENLEDNPEPINTTEFIEDFEANFEFTTAPTQLDFLILTPLVHFTQFGMHKVTIYSVNEEYIRLYESMQQDSRDLAEPFTNINNGLGIFTGFSSDVVYFNVIQE